MALLQHSLSYGLILSAGLVVVMLASVAWNPAIWVGDYPPDIRARFGPPDARMRRQKLVVALPFLALLIAVPVAAVQALPALGLTPTFLTVFAATALMVLVFNVIDLLVIDWLIFNTWQPKFIVLPGTAGLAGYRDDGFHFIAFLKGLSLCLFVGLVAGAVNGVVGGVW